MPPPGYEVSFPLPKFLFRFCWTIAGVVNFRAITSFSIMYLRKTPKNGIFERLIRVARNYFSLQRRKEKKGLRLQSIIFLIPANRLGARPGYVFSERGKQ